MDWRGNGNGRAAVPGGPPAPSLLESPGAGSPSLRNDSVSPWPAPGVPRYSWLVMMKRGLELKVV